MLGRKTKEDRPADQVRQAVPSGVDSVISKEMTIDGDCHVEGRVRIEGRIRGSVEAADLELTESGAVEGDVSSPAGKGSRPFVIAGRVSGSVRSPRVEVRSSGSVHQGIEGDEIQVRGRVQGGIVARKRLVLEETAVVEGDVRARVLGLEEGGRVNGTIVMGAGAAESAGADEETGGSAGRKKETSEPAGPGKETGGSAGEGKESVEELEEEPAA